MNKFVLKDVSVFHKDAGTLLDHISFSVPEEGIFSILGETRSGKTLLVKIMVGLRPYGMKTEGEVIYYEDKSYSILKLSKKKIHLLRGSSLLWIPQNSGGALNPLLSCEKQVLLPLEKKIGLSKKEAKERPKLKINIVNINSPWHNTDCLAKTTGGEILNGDMTNQVKLTEAIKKSMEPVQQEICDE